MKLVISTCPEKEADQLGKKLLEEKLIACVNIISNITSHYWWKGKIESDRESLLIMKTKESLVDGLISRIRELHSYDVPEILVLDVVQGNPDYLRWVEESTRGDHSSRDNG